MVNFTSLRATAERLIRENGRDMTVVKRDQVNLADPSKPWRQNLTTEDVSLTVRGVFAEFEFQDTDGTIVRRGDKQVLVAASAVEDATTGTQTAALETFDYLLDGAVRWQIVNGQSFEPGPSRVLYILQVRQ